MPWFQYDDDEVRDYHHFGRLSRGDVVEADPTEHLPEKATAADVKAWLPDHRFVAISDAQARKVLAARRAQVEAAAAGETPPPTPTPGEDPAAGTTEQQEG